MVASMNSLVTTLKQPVTVPDTVGADAKNNALKTLKQVQMIELVRRGVR
jgi:hypothetical protein